MKLVTIVGLQHDKPSTNRFFGFLPSTVWSLPYISRESSSLTCQLDISRNFLCCYSGKQFIMFNLFSCMFHHKRHDHSSKIPIRSWLCPSQKSPADQPTSQSSLNGQSSERHVWKRRSHSYYIKLVSYPIPSPLNPH